MDNKWADPAGAGDDVKNTMPVRYMIRDGGPNGNLVVHETVPSRNFFRLGLNAEPAMGVFHAMAAEDQAYSDATVDLIQEACEYFFIPPEGINVAVPAPATENADGDTDVVVERKHYTRMIGAELDPPITDDEVLLRIDRLNRGENTREADRTRMAQYPLTDLPWRLQRTLIERITELQRAWGFEILGEVDSADFAGRLLLLEAEKNGESLIKMAVAHAEGDLRQAKTKAERPVQVARQKAALLMTTAAQRHAALREVHAKGQST